MRLPEILAPAGNIEMAHAAFAAGCDAIYVGAKQYGARAYSDNFDAAELISLIAKAHRLGVRVYLTVNTLIKEQEMDAVIALLRPLADAGLDAVILQDLGLTARLRRELPNLERHASTQLSVTSLDGALALQGLGFSRLVLGRETTVEEAERIVQETSLEVEVFAHGSLCVSVSGQCYMSAFSGGRSGNRGCCAQPCRKTYTIESKNGETVGAPNTYLSPRDLMTLDRVSEFARIGVHALKIEGRMKKPEYVFAAVSAYRQALLQQPYERKELELMTNRPFTKGFFFHSFGSDMAFDREQTGGEWIGEIALQPDGKRFVCPQTSLTAGDILMLQGKHNTFPYTLPKSYSPGEPILFSARDVRVGSPVLRVYTETVRQKLKAALEAEDNKENRLPLSLSVTIAVDHPLRVIAESGTDKIVWEGEAVSAARSQALDLKTVERAFRKVGNTAFLLPKLTVSLEEDTFVPVSALNAARRSALDALSCAVSRSSVRKMPTICDATPDFAFSSAKSSEAIEGKKKKETFSVSSSDEAKSQKNPHVLLETNREPSALSTELDTIDRVLLTDLTLAKAWRDEGVLVDWAFPPLQESKAAQICWEEARSLSYPFDGITVRTLNELGHVLRYRDALSQQVPIALGFGFNLRNSEAFREVARWAKKIPIVRVALSVECTEEEVFSFPFSDVEAEMLYFGPAPGMLLRHCPCALLKSCRDERHCASCAYRREMFLVDRYGKREMVRRKGYTELLSPTKVDLRNGSVLLSRIQPSWLRVVDVGEETGDVLETIRRNHAG